MTGEAEVDFQPAAVVAASMHAPEAGWCLRGGALRNSSHPLDLVPLCRFRLPIEPEFECKASWLECLRCGRIGAVGFPLSLLGAALGAYAGAPQLGNSEACAPPGGIGYARN